MKIRFRGGPSYYMEKSSRSKNTWFIFFSVIVILTFAFIFNTVQANTIAQAFETSFNFSSVTSGIMLSCSYCFNYFWIKRIANVVSLMVLVMAIGYVYLALFV